MLCPDSRGTGIYSPNVHNVMGLTGYEEGTLRGIAYERWFADGSAEFERLYARLQEEGAFVEE